MEDKIFLIVEEYIEDRGFKRPENFNKSSDFKEISGLDSLDLTDLYLFIEGEIDVDFSENASYSSINSAENIAAYLERKNNEALKNDINV